MSGQKKSPIRRKLGVAPLPLTAGAALVAGTLTMLVWYSPGYIAADIQPLVLDFGSSQPRRQSGEVDSTSNAGQTDKETSADSSGSSRNPVRTESSNGGLVLEWPQNRSKTHTPEESVTSDAKSQARKVLQEAEDHLQAGDLRRALISARLAYSYPVKWESDELNPEELLRQLETLTSNPTVLATARQSAINEINSANSDEERTGNTPGGLALNSAARPSSVIEFATQKSSGIGVWRPAAGSERSGEMAAQHDVASNVETATYNESDLAQPEIETASATELAVPTIDNSPVSQPYRSQPSSFEAGPEPGRLDINNSHYQASETTAEFTGQRPTVPTESLDPRPLIITDQRTVTGQTESPVRKLTFDVLATLTTIFAVLFFGTLFLFLAVLAIGKKLIGEKGVAFKIELVNNSPLTLQAGAIATPEAAPQPEPVVKEVKIDPDFEGILSMSEHRARERESAILQQFIDNNVSLHNEISANRSAA